MNNLNKIGQILFALPFGVFGLFHFMMASQMAGAVPSWVPGGIFWVYVTGLALIAAAVSLVINKYAYYAALGLALLLVTFVLTVHLPGMMGGDQMAMPGLLKDLALAGAALLVAHLNPKD